MRLAIWPRRATTRLMTGLGTLALAGGLFVASPSAPVGAAVNACANPDLPPTIVGSGEIQGTSGNDVIWGSDGPDVIYGGSGSDVLCGFGGDDILIGGSGNDILEGGLGSDQLDGGSGGDSLLGGDPLLVDPADADVLAGGSGDDFLSAAGASTLDGGSGSDSLSSGSLDATWIGGSGFDTCRVPESIDPTKGAPPAPDGQLSSCDACESGPVG